MGNEQHKIYDKCLNATLNDLFNFGDQQKQLILSNFNPKDSGHLAILQIASFARDLFGYEIKVNASLWEYIKFRFYTHAKWCRRNNNYTNKSLDVPHYIKTFEEKNNLINVFNNIYNTYYRKDKTK